MLGKLIASFKNLVRKIKSIKTTTNKSGEDSSESSLTPKGTFAVYVGDERVKQVLPISYANHPLFRILLDQSHDEVNSFEQKVMLVIPCSLDDFQNVVKDIEPCDTDRTFGFGGCCVDKVV